MIFKNNLKLKKKITFYCEDIPERQLVSPLYKIFKENKYEVRITNDLSENSEIGYYCSPSTHIKKINSKFSIISLGGMDQGKLFWPNFWYKEPWDKFDLGVLPGKKWREMWQSSTWFKSALPKYGIITGGWPKTQSIKEKFKNNKNRQHKFKILYAPCFENDEKGHDVINSVKNLDVIIEIKHLPWNESFERIKHKDIRSNIAKMLIFTRNNLKNNFKIYNSKINIFDIFNKIDLLITDESSLIYEALLFDIPTLSCHDWLMRSSGRSKARYVTKNEDICNYTSRSNLQNKIKEIILNYDKYIGNIRNKKNNYFSNIDNSAVYIFNILNNMVEKNELTNLEKPKFKISYIRSFFLNLKKKLNFFFLLALK